MSSACLVNSRCCPVESTVVSAHGAARSALITGAILMHSGRVPTRQRTFFFIRRIELHDCEAAIALRPDVWHIKYWLSTDQRAAAKNRIHFQMAFVSAGEAFPTVSL